MRIGVSNRGWRWLLGLFLLGGLSLPLGCVTTPDSGKERAADSIPHPPAEGMLVLALDRPEMDLSGYRGVQIEDIAVTYAERGTRSGVGSLLSLNQDERAMLGRAFRTAMERALSKGDGYALVQGPGPGVMRLAMWIDELRLSALPPEVRAEAKGDIWARSAGSMRLAGEIRDSVSGQLLGYLDDRRSPGKSGWLFTTDPVSGWGKPDFALDFWAATLREELDRVRTNLKAER